MWGGSVAHWGLLGKGVQEDWATHQLEHELSGMPTTIKELIGRDITDDEIKEMVRKCSRDYTATCGGLKRLQAQDMEAIYKMARG